MAEPKIDPNRVSYILSSVYDERGNRMHDLHLVKERTSQNEYARYEWQLQFVDTSTNKVVYRIRVPQGREELYVKIGTTKNFFKEMPAASQIAIMRGFETMANIVHEHEMDTKSTQARYNALYKDYAALDRKVLGLESQLQQAVAKGFVKGEVLEPKSDAKKKSKTSQSPKYNAAWLASLETTLIPTPVQQIQETQQDIVPAAVPTLWPPRWTIENGRVTRVDNTANPTVGPTNE